MGTIKKFNRLAAVSLLALAAAFMSANTPLMAAVAATGDQARAATVQQQPAVQQGARQNNISQHSQPPNAEANDTTQPDEAIDTQDDQTTDTSADQTSAQPQTVPGPSVPLQREFTAKTADGPMFGGDFFHRILRDEKTIWLSPFHMSGSDLKWVIPIAGGVGALMPFDNRINNQLPTSGTRYSMFSNLSQMGAPYTVVGVAGATLLIGKLTDNEKTRETGLMATEALIHSEIVMTVMKFAAGRARPTLPDGTRTNGSFFNLESDGSFPSGHSMSAWALASVFAHQYGDDHKWIPFVAYGLASTVSISRIGAQKHFPSDVLAGSAIGFLLGRFVYRQHKAEEYAREQKWKKLIPDIGPSFAHGGIGVSMNWNLSKN